MGQKQGWTPPLISCVTLAFLTLRLSFFPSVLSISVVEPPTDPSPDGPMWQEINDGPAPSAPPPPSLRPRRFNREPGDATFG